MQTKSKLDELSQLVLDDKVVSVLIARLTTILTPIMEAIVKKVATEITTEATISLTKFIEQLCLEQSAKTEVQLSAMNDRLKALEDDNRMLSGKLENSERHSRLANLIFYGIPPSFPADHGITSESTIHKHETRQFLITGHYKTYARHPYSNQWNEFNDSK